MNTHPYSVDWKDKLSFDKKRVIGVEAEHHGFYLEVLTPIVGGKYMWFAQRGPWVAQGEVFTMDEGKDWVVKALEALNVG